MTNMLNETIIPVTIRLITPLLGTVPKSKEVYTEYILDKAPKGVAEEELDTVDLEEVERRGWTGFHKNEDGLFIYDYVIKGFLKAAGNIQKENIGIKALKSKIVSHVFVRPRRIYLDKDAPDGINERPLRARMPDGSERVALVKSDFVNEGTKLSFDLVLLPHEKLTPDTLRVVLEYGRWKGLGQARGDGWGRFEVMVYNGILIDA